ncbi:conserved hypothetical protein [Vibrio crassostreae]|uniref:hypothetical protein n=1 Tax=Vibrio crassostreae TaxID=246167 RepID=UPI001051AA9A|nr:hypothetical protein [Vibrio crassostreae]TCL30405.1 hypothetical protein EDB52_101692 [Vibrio crassostreae]CAK1713320.1 conserved hypothetical protein [Vibrio crassostreae]CAK1714430.1 conserved hypothetical protein [Vibrio crassostreae]CAK1715908.1 conserved hypothetical protein [Vibrio crassostreae]CAK1716494.1 conserved hypothetical protein [Vibrio crassostreae]
MGQQSNQDIKLEVIVRFDPKNQNGIGEFSIVDYRAEALTQVGSHTAIAAYGAKDTVYQVVNQFLKQQNELIKADHFVKTGAPQ